MDISRLEEEIDCAGETLTRVYSRPPACFRLVKTAILSRAEKKQNSARLEFTNKDIQEIGQELVHESPYNYLTYLNRKTLNDILYRLMQKQLIDSPYFNVPSQRHRNVYTKYIDVKYQELLLMEAIDRELTSLGSGLDESEGQNSLSAENDLICRIIASSAIHGAMLFRGFHERILAVSLNNIDLNNGFLTVDLHHEKEATREEATFFRHFISPITMAYILKYVTRRRKKISLSVVPVKSRLPERLFGEEWRERQKSMTALFRQWTGRIASRFGLPSGMDLERFRYVAMRYLPLKYPIFLLSVHSRALRSDSLTSYYFSPLLNITINALPRPSKTTAGGKGMQKELVFALGSDSLASSVLEIISFRGMIKSAADRKVISVQIRHRIKASLELAAQEGSETDSLLLNYKVYWEWLLYLIESTRLSPGSIATYTGSIGRHFLPLLSERYLLTSGCEYIEERILCFIERYETNSAIKALRRFFGFIKIQYPDIDLPSLFQKKFLKTRCPSPKPLIHSLDVKKVLGSVTDVPVRLIIILGFYAGLRAGEIVNLKLGNVIYDGGYVLCVRKSKTRNGARNVPLYLLMPDEFLMELVSYCKAELETRRSDDFLLIKKGKKLDSKRTSPFIQSFFERIVGLDIEFHHLRHSFANWFLIRWFTAMYGKDLFEPGCSFLQDDLFTDEYMQRLRLLLFGFQVPRAGQESFSHVFAALARLIGHGSPRITISHYIHVIDFLMHLYMRKKHGVSQVTLTRKALAELLNISPATLPKYCDGSLSQPVKIQDIIAAQKKRLGLGRNNA